MESKPTHEQAQLHLQIYDLRREARLRQARDWFQQNYRAETFDDADGSPRVGVICLLVPCQAKYPAPSGGAEFK